MTPVRHLLAALALACTTAVPLAHADDSAGAVGAEMTAYNQRYNDIAARHDLDAFIALYTGNPLWIAPTEAPVAGLDVPRNTFGFIKKHEGKLTHTADHVFVSKDGMQAVLIGRYNAVIEAVGNASSGTYLFVLTRDSDEDDWAIAVDMFNAHSPG